jgi:hypothetical protein
MDPFHERLARVALEAGAKYGFVLAGGYAVQAHGLVERESKDVDIFTTTRAAADFIAAVDHVVSTPRADGLRVTNQRTTEAFARLVVTDPAAGNSAVMELAVDWRANEPVRLDIGPVLHPDDAVASKMSALFGRAMARDFIDIDAVIASGRYGRPDLLRLSEERDSGFSIVTFADALGAMRRLDDAEFAAYGLSPTEIAAMRQRFAEWREDLLKEGGMPPS